MNDFKFSVSMCVYGGDNPAFFKEAVDSIVNQTKKPTEVVIVVDGPVSNETDKILEELSKNDLFKILRLDTNQGHGIARKTGLENCSNELVAIMDADDISVSDRFEKQIKFFVENFDVDIVGGQIAEFVDDTNDVVGKRIVPLEDNSIKRYMKKRCPMNQTTVMFKKKSVEDSGGYIDWFCDEDYYLWIRMAQHNMKLANIDEPLVYTRVADDMYQRRGGIKYFKSEAKLQKYMLDNRIIGFGTYLNNVSKRLILQVFMPNKLRGWVFQKFARS